MFPERDEMEFKIRKGIHEKENISLQELINNHAMQAEVDRIKEATLKQAKQYMEQEPLSDLRKKNTDMLLDEYNDYMSLYNVFKDNHYKQRADMVMAIIKSKSNKAS
jgi:hypothetical protein